MEQETSQFESSEMLAAYLASTPLLEESWRRCRNANAAAQLSFAVDRVGTVAYVAFSGVQVVDCAEESCWSLVNLESGGGKGIFGPFCGGDEEEPVMVHGGLLRLFLSFYHTHNFQQKIHEVVNECKSVIFTGHSLGGAVASLSTLWLLSILQTINIHVMCITFGSPMLGNQSFSRAVLQERWAGHFIHVVAQNDIVPRLLFAPPSSFMDHLPALIHFWHSSMTSCIVPNFSCGSLTELCSVIASCLEGGSGAHRGRTSFWPFGSYMLCTGDGAICLDNGVAIVRFLYLMLVSSSSSSSCVKDHLAYEDCVGRASWRYLTRNMSADTWFFSESSTEAGTALALRSSGLDIRSEEIEPIAKNSLALARRLGCSRNLNAAKMAVSLSKVTPLRAQIEWYKAFCDHHHSSYYDSFKQRGASKRGSKVNMNRIRLATFWDKLLFMIDANRLPHDFHKLPKYVNASRSYALLVEPLEIAEYYRTGEHEKKGHYVEHGRAKRFKVFEKWWRERKVGDEENGSRSRFASLTQDSCFWARVEEARDYVYRVTSEVDSGRHLELLDEIGRFERYAREVVERKEVSVDVLAKDSSYSLFKEEWEVLKCQLKLGSQDGMVQEICLECLEAEGNFMSIGFP
ncbi:alpha/beta-Hydrolases superfamily protein [Striga asiatica]|uniref:Alpha/beta-Hydrolases superfamily protein n=1 Tax=Striga asiatica TaxID=4170 RepID=A0A5A7Q4T1_STRAF|nr:alpha/beta-Hydrolases superfamily protein [Striga asiatica]